MNEGKDKSEDRKALHIMIGRACGPDPDSACVQAKAICYAEPNDEDIAWMEDGLRKTYRNAFHDDAVRVGVALLPYVEEYDGDDDDE